MKKLKNGFTLIELLAVIIILAIVALIATPIILNVVDDAKISAGKSEAQMILGGINNYCATEDVKAQMDEDYVRICTSSLDAEKVKEMVNLGNATIERIRYNGSKLTELVIESNNHTFTLCPSGTFAIDDEKCDVNISVITTGPIKDVVLSNFPYLETNGNGCVTSTDNNYSYMGGCYLKGSANDFYDGKDNFLKKHFYMTKEQIEKTFFDSNGDFKSQEYEDHARKVAKENGMTDEEINEMLEQEGVSTFFELDFNMTSQEAMTKTGKDMFYSIMLQVMDEETINKTFFDAEGNFIAENFENWAFTDGKLTEEQLKQEGVDTAFEFLTLEIMGKPMKSEELFGLKGTEILIYEMLYFGIPFSRKEIEKKFFDNAGNFKLQEYENYAREFAKEFGKTDEEINKELQENGVETLFELDCGMTPKDFFAQKGNSLWYSGFLWRIMGINADGTIRLITDENITAIPWGESNTAQNWDDSYAKDWLNNYFYPRLKGNNIIVEQTWCSETTTEKNSMRTTCTNNLSTEKLKVGLITIDEYNLAGGSSSYLNIGQYQWTMTLNSSSSAWNVFNNGSASGNSVSNTFGLRAVINVNSDVTITGGNGTLGVTWSSQAGPYILNEDKNEEITGKLSEKATSGEYVLFAGKKYRVVDKDSNSNTKLILDGYYEEDGNIFKMKYGETTSKIFSITTGIGQKLNDDVLNWITNNNNTEKGKLVNNYTWYQNEFYYGDSYTVSLNEENPIRRVQATVGLIRIGEMLSDQSSSILTKGYTTISNYNKANDYWTLTSHISINCSAWYVNNYGKAYFYIDDYDVSSLRPVIVIKSDVEIISGTGTWSNPYQI